MLACGSVRRCDFRYLSNMTTRIGSEDPQSHDNLGHRVMGGSAPFPCCLQHLSPPLPVVWYDRVFYARSPMPWACTVFRGGESPNPGCMSRVSYDSLFSPFRAGAPFVGWIRVRCMAVEPLNLETTWEWILAKKSLLMTYSYYIYI